MNKQDARELTRLKCLLEEAVAALNSSPAKQTEVLNRFGWHRDLACTEARHFNGITCPTMEPQDRSQWCENCKQREAVAEEWDDGDRGDCNVRGGAR